MKLSHYSKLVEAVKEHSHLITTENGTILIAPNLAGRVFAELDGYSPHRIDLATVAKPDQPFNNFGGMNLWPAPEGGEFGFNYQNGEWLVQPAINDTPYQVAQASKEAAHIEKQVSLVNARGVKVEVEISRSISLALRSSRLDRYPVKSSLAYRSVDRMRVLNQVSPSDALLSAWNLEQFNATEETVSFVSVENPRESINFDFYEPRPHSQIAYGPRGFTYQTNGKQRGQIGIHESAKPTLIGFYDLKNNFLCLKENQSSNEGLFFNIADNEQKQGAYSARDFYSIFNSDESMSAFELETIAPLIVENGYLKESTLISTTTFATFSDSSSLLHFLKEIGILGS